MTREEFVRKQMELRETVSIVKDGKVDSAPYWSEVFGLIFDLVESQIKENFRHIARNLRSQ